MSGKDILKLLLGISIITSLIYLIGFGKVYTTLKSVNPVYLIPIFPMLFLSFGIGALNLKILSNLLEVDVPFFRLLHYSILTWSFGLLALGKAGEASLIYFLSKERMSMGQATAIFMFDRLMTLFVLSLLSVIGCVLFFSWENAVYAILLLLISFSLALFLLYSNITRTIVKRYIFRTHSIKFEGFSKTSRYITTCPHIVIVNFILTLFKWMVLSGVFLITFYSFGATISIFHIVLVVAITKFISFIPVSMSGMGIKEAGAIYLYSLVGVPPPITIGVYLIINAINYIVGINYIVFSTGTLKFPSRKIKI